MSVCLECNRPLDEDYEEIGLCPKCLDIAYDIENDYKDNWYFATVNGITDDEEDDY